MTGGQKDRLREGQASRFLEAARHGFGAPRFSFVQPNASGMKVPALGWFA